MRELLLSLPKYNNGINVNNDATSVPKLERARVQRRSYTQPMGPFTLEKKKKNERLWERDNYTSTDKTKQINTKEKDLKKKTKKQMRAKSCQQCGNQGPTTEHARRSLIKLRLA